MTRIDGGRKGCRTMKTRSALTVCGVLFLSAFAGQAADDGFAALAAEADEVVSEWPAVVTSPTGRIIVYQPQLERFENDRLAAISAVAIDREAGSEPVLGAVWFSCRILTDRQRRESLLLDFDIENSKFSDLSEEEAEQVVAHLKAALPKQPLKLSLDRLVTALGTIDGEDADDSGLDNSPPRIIIVDYPAVLVVIAGEPVFAARQDGGFEQVVNTPYFLIRVPKTGRLFLKGGDRWLTAGELNGPWSPAADVPPEILAAAALDGVVTGTEGSSDDNDPLANPIVIVATEPTELISTVGPPVFGAIAGTDLLYVKNTGSDLFYHSGERKIFVLLSGRWFASPTKDGPWEFVPPDKLHADFARIPEDSAKGHVLASVAGTREAGEALMDTYVPQTAVVDRDAGSGLAVEYDGKPEFERIADTGMWYAVNSPQAIVWVDNTYYCNDSGVWYYSVSPMGRWTVCTSVPEVIYTIPASCPLYYVTFSYVFGYTPRVVYCGYYPGYWGCYRYRRTVCYGTGWRYRHWRGDRYYPRHATYGYHTRYHHHSGTWEGSHGYVGYDGWIRGGGSRRGDMRHGQVIHDGWRENGGLKYADHRTGGDSMKNKYSEPNHHPKNGGNHQAAGEVKIQGGNRPASQTVGISEQQWQRIRDKMAALRTGGGAAPQAKIPDRELFADRSGNVYRKTLAGWEQRRDQQWQALAEKTTGMERIRETSVPRPAAGAERPSFRLPDREPAAPQTKAAAREPGVTRRILPPNPLRYREQSVPVTRLLDQELKARDRGEQRTLQFRQAVTPQINSEPARTSSYGTSGTRAIEQYRKRVSDGLKR